MIEKLLQYSTEHQLFKKDDHILVATSGGVDSVVLVHVLHALNISIGVAHCNFQLRGEEANQDELHVRTIAKQLNIPFFSIRFDTEQVAKEKGISIQMAARELRYDWFEQIRKENNYTFIATAHHLDDDIETFFMRSLQGSGLKGLTGISPKNGKVIRPLLFATKEQIRRYAESKSLFFREDASNQENKYVRNAIRNKLIPLLQEIYPEADKTVPRTLQNLKEAYELYLFSLHQITHKIVFDTGKEQIIEFNKLLKYPTPKTILFEIVQPLGFTFSQVEDLYCSFQQPEACFFYSETHRMIKDRKRIYISPREELDTSIKFMDKPKGKIRCADYTLELKTVPIQKFKPNSKANVACLDMHKLEFPLQLRYWKPGDYFYPLGLEKKKKLSRFFIDNKVPVVEKEKTQVLLSGDKIIWVVGHRIDNRFKVTSKTREVLRINLQHNNS